MATVGSGTGRPAGHQSPVLTWNPHLTCRSVRVEKTKTAPPASETEGSVRTCLRWRCVVSLSSKQHSQYINDVLFRAVSNSTHCSFITDLKRQKMEDWQRANVLQNSLYRASDSVKEMQLLELTLCDVIDNKALIPLPDLLTTTAAMKSATTSCLSCKSNTVAKLQLSSYSKSCHFRTIG